MVDSDLSNASLEFSLSYETLLVRSWAYGNARERVIMPITVIVPGSIKGPLSVLKSVTSIRMLAVCRTCSKFSHASETWTKKRSGKEGDEARWVNWIQEEEMLPLYRMDPIIVVAESSLIADID